MTDVRIAVLAASADQVNEIRVPDGIAKRLRLFAGEFKAEQFLCCGIRQDDAVRCIGHDDAVADAVDNGLRVLLLPLKKLQPQHDFAFAIADFFRLSARSERYSPSALYRGFKGNRFPPGSDTASGFCRALKKHCTASAVCRTTTPVAVVAARAMPPRITSNVTGAPAQAAATTAITLHAANAHTTPMLYRNERTLSPCPFCAAGAASTILCQQIRQLALRIKPARVLIRSVGKVMLS